MQCVSPMSSWLSADTFLVHAVPPEQTARGLGLYSLETGYPCVILDG